MGLKVTAFKSLIKLLEPKKPTMISRNIQVRAPAGKYYCWCINRLRLRPRPYRRRGAAGRHVIVVFIVNIALEGREEQTAATTRLRLRPFPSRAPPSRFERCRRRSQDSAGEREEGHPPNDGRCGRAVRSCARPPPPPRDATVRFRGSGGSSDDDDDKNKGNGGSAAAALAWRRRR